MYAVMVINKKQKVRVNNCSPALESEIDICWADGMIGAIPVFETYEDAEKYAGIRQVIQLDEVIDNSIGLALTKEII